MPLLRESQLVDCSVVVWIKQIVFELPNQRACQGFLFGDGPPH